MSAVKSAKKASQVSGADVLRDWVELFSLIEVM